MPVEPQRRKRLQKGLSAGELELVDEGIFLAGTPEHLSGYVTVHNRTDSVVKPSALALKPSVLPAADTAVASLAQGSGNPGALSAPPVGMLLKFGRGVGPGERREAPVRLKLGPGTPPGRYQLALTDDRGVERPVTVDVLEHRATRLVPAALEVVTSPGGTVQFEVHVANLGNLPTSLPGAWAAMVQPLDRTWNQQFHAAARSSGGKGYEAFLSDFVSRMGAEEPPVVRVRLLDGAGDLPPQQARRVRVSVEVPAGLGSGRRFQCTLQIGEEPLALVLRTERARVVEGGATE